MNPILQKLLTAAATLITPQATTPTTAAPVPVPIKIQVGTLPSNCKLVLTSSVGGQTADMPADPAMNVIGLQLQTGDTLGLNVICDTGARASRKVQATAPTTIAFGDEAPVNTWDVYMGNVPGLSITTP